MPHDARAGVGRQRRPEDRVRLVGKRPAVAEGELTLRLEGMNSKAEAVRVAETVE